MSTILKSLAVCLVLLGAWHLTVKRLPAKYRAGGEAGSQVEQNVMRGEAFVYAQAKPRVVVVGSSIANRLRDLPRDWYNLSFNGGSAFTGLEMMLRANKIPDVVLIETNVLMLDADEQQLRSLFSPGLYEARRKLPLLRETNKPHLIAQRALIDDDHRPTKSNAPATDDPAPTAAAAQAEADAADVALPHEQFERLKVRRGDELSAPLESAKLDKIVRDLKHYATELKARGAEVIFFEMPEHADFMAKPRPASVRLRVREAFPAETSKWVVDVEPSAYRTTDFVHLTARSAARYAGVLKAHVAALAPVEPKASRSDVARVNGD
ncbi:MAG: hypothetical protein WBD40_13350 [Tepidisphaeraceae bacterium]